jgi:hypothetical protein
LQQGQGSGCQTALLLRLLLRRLLNTLGLMAMPALPHAQHWQLLQPRLRQQQRRQQGRATMLRSWQQCWQQ